MSALKSFPNTRLLVVICIWLLVIEELLLLWLLLLLLLLVIQVFRHNTTVDFVSALIMVSRERRELLLVFNIHLLAFIEVLWAWCIHGVSVHLPRNSIWNLFLSKVLLLLLLLFIIIRSSNSTSIGWARIGNRWFVLFWRCTVPGVGMMEILS